MIHHSNKADLKQRVVLGARAYGIGSVLFRRLAGQSFGVNDTDMECFGAIFYQKLATPSQLARYTGLSSGATTTMLDRLEKGGLIERKPNPQDRRSTIITISKDGAAKARPLFESLRISQDKIMSSYAEQELGILADFFEKSEAMWDEERQKLIDQQANTPA
jgi:DNA-binding MarR family transcriptional regulator